MNRKFKVNLLDVYGLCGTVFAAVGTVFILFAVVGAARFDTFQYSVEGDPVMFLFIFGILGLVVAGLGYGILFWHIGKIRKQKKVFENGYYINVPVSDIRLETRVRVNGRYPYVVEAQYGSLETGEVHLFRSRYLMHNPGNIVNGQTVPVYVIPPDYENYYMDIDAIL